MEMDVEIVQAISRQTAQIEALTKRMDNLEKLTDSVNKMAITLERLTAQESQTEEKVSKLTTDVDEIRMKPAKRWELVVGAIISALVGAGIALLIK